MSYSSDCSNITYAGPYSGEFYTKEQHGKLPPSGNAWELWNPSGPGTLGFIDPRNGVKDIQRDWMVKVCLIPFTLPSSLMLIF